MVCVHANIVSHSQALSVDLNLLHMVGFWGRICREDSSIPFGAGVGALSTGRNPGSPPKLVFRLDKQHACELLWTRSISHHEMKACLNQTVCIYKDLNHQKPGVLRWCEMDFILGKTAKQNLHILFVCAHCHRQVASCWTMLHANRSAPVGVAETRLEDWSTFCLAGGSCCWTKSSKKVILSRF